MRLEYPQTPLENIALGKWVAKRIPGFQPTTFRTIAFFEEGEGIKAAVLYHNYRVTDIEVAFACDTKDWARRDLMEEVLAYPFKIGCNRITALARKDNKKVRKMLVQLGFKQEGKIRRADADGMDMFIYGLLPGEYRFGRKERLRKAA